MPLEEEEEGEKSTGLEYTQNEKEGSLHLSHGVIVLNCEEPAVVNRGKGEGIWSTDHGSHEKTKRGDTHFVE